MVLAGCVLFLLIRSLFKKNTGDHKDYDGPDIDFPDIDDFTGGH